MREAIKCITAARNDRQLMTARHEKRGWVVERRELILQLIELGGLSAKPD